MIVYIKVLPSGLLFDASSLSSACICCISSSTSLVKRERAVTVLRLLIGLFPLAIDNTSISSRKSSGRTEPKVISTSLSSKCHGWIAYLCNTSNDNMSSTLNGRFEYFHFLHRFDESIHEHKLHTYTCDIAHIFQIFKR